MNTDSLNKRSYVVTGAGSGIGYAILRCLLSQGAQVAGLDHSNVGLEKIAETGAHAIRADVRDPEALRSAISQARSAMGRLDGIVNNAGVTVTAPFLEADVALWDRLWETNQRSVLVGCQAAAQIMVADKRAGSIVNIASVHGSASDQSYEGYAATKGAICAMGRSMAWSLGPHGIRVNTLSPGLTLPPEMGQPENAAMFQTWHADGSVASTPDEIAQIAAFLLSEAAVAITGMDLVADKGTLARVCNVG